MASNMPGSYSSRPGIRLEVAVILIAIYGTKQDSQPQLIPLAAKGETAVGKIRKYRSLRRNHIASTLKASYDRKCGALMFLDNLSANLLQICDAEQLNYDRASEKCDCGSKHFSNIIRKHSYPSLKVFENICLGFQRTPNCLLGVEPVELSFRIPMPVVETRVSASTPGRPSFPVCPKCHCNLDRIRQHFCSNCGQNLSWRIFLK